MSGGPLPVHDGNTPLEPTSHSSTTLSDATSTDQSGLGLVSGDGGANAGQDGATTSSSQGRPSGSDPVGAAAGGGDMTAPPAFGAPGMMGDGGGGVTSASGSGGRGGDPFRAPSAAGMPRVESSLPADTGRGGTDTRPATAADTMPTDVRGPVPGQDVTSSPVSAGSHAEGAGRAEDPVPTQRQDPRPPLSALREVRPGRQGVIDPADQARVEARFPRDENGVPLKFRNPLENDRILVSNDGGPSADPFRANNCLDQAAAEIENWHGDPQVSAPRYPEYVNGEPSTAGEVGGIQKIEALFGAKLGYDGSGADGYQHLADNLREAGHGAAAVVVVDWGDGSSHAFNAFNHEGTILWTDGQSGLVSADTPLWPQAQHVWSVGMDADRNPLPGYEPLDDAQALPEPVPSTDIPTQSTDITQPDARTDADLAAQLAQSDAGLDGLKDEISRVDVRDPSLQVERPTPDAAPEPEHPQPPAGPTDPGARSADDRDQAGVDRGHEQDAGQVGHDAAGAVVPDSGSRGQEAAAEAAAVVDAARQAAALTRADDGGFTPEAVQALLDGLPSLPDDSEASISALVEKVYSGEVQLQLLDGRAGSERPVYRAFVDGELAGFVKVVPDGNEFAAELSAAERLREAGLTAFNTPDLLGVAKLTGPDGVERGVLFSKEAPGVSIDAVLRQVPLAWDGDSAMADLHSAVVGVAEGLAELHGVGADRTASPEFLTPHIEAIRNHLNDLANSQEALSRLGIDIDQIRAEAEQRIAAALADPGPAGLAHGDAHLGNFLWDEDAGVSLIDAPTLHASMDAAGEPIGSPARDFALFDQRLGQFGTEFGLKPEQIADLRKEFADAYAEHGGPAVPEHIQALFEARAAAHRLARAVQRLEERPDDPRNGPAAGAAGAALQHALGIDDSVASRVASGFAGELPGAPEYRRDWVAIDNFRSYMRNVADPEVRARFETEFGDRIIETQRRQSEQFKKLWKDLFPHRDEEVALSAEGSRRAEKLVGDFTAQANELVREMSDFATQTGIPALAPDAVARTIDREGTAAWEASLRETQAKINEVIDNVTYDGQPVGFIGSMKSGWRGSHKGKTHFDPHDFDVDLYVVVDRETFDRIAATYPGLDKDEQKIMPDEDNPPDLVALAAQIGRALNEKFPDTPGIENSTIALRVEPPW